MTNLSEISCSDAPLCSLVVGAGCGAFSCGWCVAVELLEGVCLVVVVKESWWLVVRVCGGVLSGAEWLFQQ
ncbi:hypothetical protein, partial [Streptomyces sp. NPDC058773]|uniref:hypothetical protein n=1 Tax=Streptomyces sp. NPDC058773 TaxID=3346632 RepID=UPI0036C5687C